MAGKDGANPVRIRRDGSQYRHGIFRGLQGASGADREDEFAAYGRTQFGVREAPSQECHRLSVPGCTQGRPQREPSREEGAMG